MKKRMALLIALSMLVSVVTGCGGPVEIDKDGDGKLEITCTIYPVYDWVSKIAGDKANVTYLLDSGVDLHNYQPTVKDLVSIKESDLFIYVGGDSDEWADDIVDRSFNHINLMELAGELTLDEEESEGMQEVEDDHGHDHAHADEHVWMSVEISQDLVEGIMETLMEIDPENANYYKSNGDAYLDELELLEDEYELALAQYTGATIIVADRFPLLYLVEDYDLEYFAAFSGCSADAEVSFETLKFLSDKYDELGHTYMFQLEDSGQKIAASILGTNQNVLTINSMQSVTGDISELSYVNIMKENLETLVKALSKHNESEELEEEVVSEDVDVATTEETEETL